MSAILGSCTSSVSLATFNKSNNNQNYKYIFRSSIKIKNNHSNILKSKFTVNHNDQMDLGLLEHPRWGAL